MTAVPGVHDSVASLPHGFALPGLRPMPYPRTVLLCPPDHFEVVDVKNPFMAGNVGSVRREEARREWDALRALYERLGLETRLCPPTPGCEDMVFCANQTLPGLDAQGERVCLLSHMRHPSRRREVPAFAAWFRAAGYAVEDPVPPTAFFEGSGDALWHPGRGLIWGGHGERSSPEAYGAVAARFGVPVLRLALRVPPFYHLDTCFAALDERTVLVHLPALTEEGRALVRRVFARVIEADPEEAEHAMACNAAAYGGRHVVLDRRAARTARALREHGFEVHEVETGEFMKSGGSVFCLKMYVF